MAIFLKNGIYVIFCSKIIVCFTTRFLNVKVNSVDLDNQTKFFVNSSKQTIYIYYTHTHIDTEAKHSFTASW